MSDILSLETPYQDQDTVTSTNLNDLVKKATFTSAVVDGATTQLSSGAIIVRDGGVTEQKLSTAAQAKLLQGPEIAVASSNSEAFEGGTKTGNARGTFALDIQNKQTTAALTKVASGDSAVALGVENTASGDYSTAVGSFNDITTGSDVAEYSSAFGYNNDISEKNSVAVGKSNSITSQSSIAIGESNSCSDFQGIAIGNSNTASGGSGIAIGISNTSTANAVAIGANNDAINGGIAVGVSCDASNSAIAVGETCNASSSASVAIGINSECAQISSFVVGNGAKVLSGSSIQTFEVGNGRTNALRGHPNGQIASTLENSATAPTDGGSTNFAEADLTLPREMFSIQRNGDAFTLYFNDAGTIKSLLLGSVS